MVQLLKDLAALASLSAFLIVAFAYLSVLA